MKSKNYPTPMVLIISNDNPDKIYVVSNYDFESGLWRIKIKLKEKK